MGLRKGTAAAALFLVMMIGFAAGAKDEPEWVKSGNASEQFPASRYLVGIGRAADTGGKDQDLKAAENAARNEIASQIRTQIQSTLVSRMEEQQKYVQTNARSKSTTQGTQQVVSEIMTKVDLELVATEIKESYFNKKEKQYYALAVMDRNLAAETLRKKFALTRQAAEGFFREGQGALQKNDGPRALQNFKKAKDELVKIEGNEAMLDVLTGQAAPASPEALTVAKCEVAMDQAMDSIRFVVQIYEVNPTQPRSVVVQSKLIQGLRQKGYNVMDNAATFANYSYDQLSNASTEQLRALPGLKGSYLILGQAVAKPSSSMAMGNSFVYFFMTSADLKIVNLDTGKILVNEAFDWGDKTKSGKASPEKAASDSLTRAGAFLADKVSEKVEDIFKSLQ